MSTVAPRACSLYGMSAVDLRDLDAVVDGLAAAAAAVGCEVRRLGVAEPPPIGLPAALSRALERPVGTPPLRELARGRRSAVIITSDATRPVPTCALIGPVMAELEAAGVSRDAVDVVIGGGAHRPARPEEIERLLGPEWAGRLRVSCHDAKAADLVDLGRTPAGTPLRVDPRVAAADLRISFGQVEPHEFAGFTGGRKSILPAVAAEASILANHSIANLSHSRARPGVLDGNPIHEDMLAAMRLASLDFVVNVVLAGDLRPLAVAAGDPEAAHATLVAFVRAYAQLGRPQGPVDVVLTGPGAPLDINLYQSTKPLVGLQPMIEGMAAEARSVAGAGTLAGSAAWRPPVVVLLSSCWDGTGSDEMLVPFDGASGPADVLKRLRERYTVEMNESFNIARFLTVCPRVVACCPGVGDDVLRRLFFTPAPTPQAALETALVLATNGSAGGPGPTAGRDSDVGRRRSVLVFPRAQRALFV
jgi:nickel-dependent lactate racemase